MDIKELRKKGKALGIKQASNMKEETLLKRIKSLESPKEVINLSISKGDRGCLDRRNFNFKALETYALELGGNKLQYNPRRKAFECLDNKCLIDLLSISMF